MRTFVIIILFATRFLILILIFIDLKISIEIFSRSNFEKFSIIVFGEINHSDLAGEIISIHFDILFNSRGDNAFDINSWRIFPVLRLYYSSIICQNASNSLSVFRIISVIVIIHCFSDEYRNLSGCNELHPNIITYINVL